VPCFCYAHTDSLPEPAVSYWHFHRSCFSSFRYLLVVAVHHRVVRLWYCAVIYILIMATSSRSDRRPGNRSAFEAARLKVLKTQTICGICGKPVDFSYRYPHPLSPTVDHIIPVSKGGHPSDLSNLQLAHRCCNRQKSDRLLPSPVAADSEDKLIANNVLEQHMVWANYRAK